MDLSKPDAKPSFFVMPEAWIQRDIRETHDAYVAQHGGRRPVAVDSVHHALSEDRIADWKDRWTPVVEAFRLVVRSGLRPMLGYFLAWAVVTFAASGVWIELKLWVLGPHTLDELLSERDKINQILQQIIDEQTAPWGIKVSVVEVKDVEIPSGMQRAMARQAEAERERRAKVIAAEGEFQASSKLADAAAVIAEHPIALQLRYLQTLLEISGTNNTSTVLPVPLDLLRAIRPGGTAE